HSESFQRLSQAPDELGIMAISSDRSTAAVVHQDDVRLLPLESALQLDPRVLQVGSHYHRLALHPQALWMAMATRDANFVHLWNLAHGEGVNASFTIPSTQYFAFSPDGQWLVTCWEGQFCFYRVGLWKEPAFSIPRKGSSNQHAPVAFTKDGLTAAISASRYTIQLVRLPQGHSHSNQLKTVATLESPDRSPLELLAFSPDGRALAAATADRTIQLWNLARLRNGLAELDLAHDWPEYP
ncbi:MAG TPA: WD40 repeat domain-containing protein, partial [Desulfuromonadaceae bacterium]|nr:WD40 repeat domain-containing protein [Desulfuromonadaceae bacterium]